MKFLIILFLICFINLSINGQTYNTNSEGSVNFPPKSYDTTDYSNVSIVKKLGNYSDESFIYKFSVGKNNFRAVHIKSDSFPQTIVIQKFNKNKWYNRLEFNEQDKFNGITLEDVNKDGYIDLVRGRYFDGECYLYKPSINNFIDSVCGELNYDIFLIDTTNKVWCDFQEYRQNCGNIFSTLYSFINYSKYNLYHLQLYNCSNDHSVITKLILSECINGDYENLKHIRTILLKKPLNANKEHYFDDKIFWRREYKKLLGYR